MARPPVSACIITLNEEANLPDCLASVAWCEEIVVVDSESADRTREIAEAAGARVLVQPFLGHVEQKNFALDRATHDWVLSVDADERVTPELRASIEAALAEDGERFDGYRMTRHTFYLGRWIDHSGWYPEWHVRLWRRSKARWSGVNPHDHVHPEGPVGTLRGDLQHFSYRSVEAHLRQVNSFTTIQAREKRARGERPSLAKLLFNPAGRFLRMYVWRRGFLDGFPGLALAAIGAFYVFSKYAKLWDIARREGAGP